MDKHKEKLASFSKQEAEDSAVKQFTELYNNLDEKDLDMTKLEVVLRNTFYAGTAWKEAVIEKEKENMKDKAAEALIVVLREFIGHIPLWERPPFREFKERFIEELAK